MTLKEMQKKVFQNKVNKGFNVTNIEYDFCLLYGEVSETFEAYLKKKPDLHEELADIVIYVLGLSEMLGVDFEKALIDKIEKNEKRIYKKINGVPIRVSEGKEE